MRNFRDFLATRAMGIGSFRGESAVWVGGGCVLWMHVQSFDDCGGGEDLLAFYKCFMNQRILFILMTNDISSIITKNLLLVRNKRVKRRLPRTYI